MKRCPECRRDYYEDTLLYCLYDGTALLDGPGSANESRAAIPHGTAPPEEAATRALGSASGKTSRDRVLTAIKTNTLGVAIAAVVILVIIAGFGYGLYALLRGVASAQIHNTSRPTAALKLQPLTASGNVREAA